MIRLPMRNFIHRTKTPPRNKKLVSTKNQNIPLHIFHFTKHRHEASRRRENIPHCTIRTKTKQTFSGALFHMLFVKKQHSIVPLFIRRVAEPKHGVWGDTYPQSHFPVIANHSSAILGTNKLNSNHDQFTLDT